MSVRTLPRILRNKFSRDTPLRLNVRPSEPARSYYLSPIISSCLQRVNTCLMMPSKFVSLRCSIALFKCMLTNWPPAGSCVRVSLRDTILQQRLPRPRAQDLLRDRHNGDINEDALRRQAEMAPPHDTPHCFASVPLPAIRLPHTRRRPYLGRKGALYTLHKQGFHALNLAARKRTTRSAFCVRLLLHSFLRPASRED